MDKYRLIGRLPREQRKHEIRKLYEELRGKGFSYAGIAELTGLTRNQVAADIRDSKEDVIGIDDERDEFFIAHPGAPLEKVQPSRVQLRAAVYDIETTSLDADGYDGFIICACFLDIRTGELRTVKINIDENHGDDRRVLSEIFDIIGQYQILIGHNVAAFDYNMLLSRAMYHHMPPPPFHHYIDTYQIARSLAVAVRKGLGNMIDWLSLDGEKTTIRKTSWSKIRSKDEQEFEEALADIVIHCQLDVIANQRLFDMLYPYAISMKRGGSLIKDAKIAYVGI